MNLKQALNPASYVFNGRFNAPYMGATLMILKNSQHLYTRESIVKMYRFLADIIENGEFEWGGTIALDVPTLENSAKKSLPETSKNGNMATKKDKSGSKIATDESGTTPPNVNDMTANHGGDQQGRRIE